MLKQKLTLQNIIIISFNGADSVRGHGVGCNYCLKIHQYNLFYNLLLI